MTFSRLVLIALLNVSLALGCVKDSASTDPGQVQQSIEGKLSATVTLNKAKAGVGDSITATTTIHNSGDQPLNLYVGYSHSGNDLQNGSLLAMQKEDAAKLIGHQWCVGFCGTGSYPMFITIPAGKSQSFTVTGTIQNDQTGLHLRCGYVRFPLKEEGKFVTWLEHTVTKKTNEQSLKHFESMKKALKLKTGPDPKAPFWHGKLTSNKAKLEVVKN